MAMSDSDITVDYLEQRARRADPDLSRRLLSRVSDAEPTPGDELPTETQALPSGDPTKHPTGSGDSD